MQKFSWTPILRIATDNSITSTLITFKNCVDSSKVDQSLDLTFASELDGAFLPGCTWHYAGNLFYPVVLVMEDVSEFIKEWLARLNAGEVIRAKMAGVWVLFRRWVFKIF